MSVDITFGRREVTVALVGEIEPTVKYAAISPVLGVIHHVIQMGGMTRELFTEFLNNTALYLNGEETHYLIYDGAPAHRGAADPTDDVHVKMLPPYSPFLNPVN
jgi:hypothetical protein